MPSPDIFADLIKPWPSADGVTIEDIKASGDVNFQNNKGINCLDPVSAQDVATKNYVDNNAPAPGAHASTHFDGGSDEISLDQLKPSGDVDMDSNKIINVTDPTSDQHAATKKYVDDNSPPAGGAHAGTHFFGSGDMIDLAKLKPSGDVDMDSNKIINVTDPTSDQHAATKKYVDDNASNYKVINATRDMQGVDGDVAYTGVGFQPSAIIAFAGVDGELRASWGMSTGTGTLNQGMAHSENSGNAELGAFLVTLQNDGASEGQNAVVKSFDSDGFTLTWDRLLAPTAGTAQLKFICFK